MLICLISSGHYVALLGVTLDVKVKVILGIYRLITVEGQHCMYIGLPNHLHTPGD